MYDWIIGSLMAGSAIVVILGVIFIIALVIAYVLISLGLYAIAQKRNLPYPWMAWIPVLRYYLLGLMLKNELVVTPQLRIPFFQYILPASYILSWLGSGSFLGTLFSIISYVLVVLALIALFRQYQEPNAIVYGLLAGLPMVELIGCFLVYQLGQKPTPDLSVDATVFP